MMITLFLICGKHKSSFIKGLKCSLNLIGICDDYMAEPFHRFRRKERNIIRKYLINIDAEIQGISNNILH